MRALSQACETEVFHLSGMSSGVNIQMLCGSRGAAMARRRRIASFISASRL